MHKEPDLFEVMLNLDRKNASKTDVIVYFDSLIIIIGYFSGCGKDYLCIIEFLSSNLVRYTHLLAFKLILFCDNHF